MKVERTNKYKYLGLVINEKNDLSDHLIEIKAKTEAAYSSIMSLCQNQNFKGLEMETPYLETFRNLYPAYNN